MKLHCVVLPLLATVSLANASKQSVTTLRGGSQRSGHRADPDTERFAREAWLASHLKDVFELDRSGRLAPQSGLGVAWDHKETRPRSARNDCDDGPGSVAAAHQRQLDNAKKQGKLEAARLSGR
mmetsp:Transcript_1749/g.4690  ORF Transcript_1749/g.4690 Transcript_1749/m.4690 type:complete len:124 (-) Transcript_1749:159-530(-)|eukprot:CAMPEP_0171210040 /NCGR_PEP_ID=MMETSP0790-20130122/28903_1 /TAXON_ID=2925 /ORGANISM="Alexandrium catenella, Strain OF101" /LENGTH=123 /DNA_ID=CAMNT_0011675663 /DNA_START=63 /DNA_END=434 /DNA_ORIENTATION=+